VSYEDEVGKMSENVKKLKNVLEAGAKSAEVQFKTKMLVSRSTPQTIIDEIEVQNPYIVVMGPHGLTGLKKLLLGSVSTKVLKKSTVLVLIVK